jgi:hypothetical protein
VAFTLPAFLNLRQRPLQSQPQALQYHSLMPSHSSRLEMIALPSWIAFWSAAVGMPWTTGITAAAPHSGQFGAFFAFRRRSAVVTMRVATFDDRSTRDKVSVFAAFGDHGGRPEIFTKLNYSTKLNTSGAEFADSSLVILMMNVP